MSILNKYRNGKIYKIINDSHPDLVYYGSTYKSLNRRFWSHKKDYSRRSYNNKMTSFELLKYDDSKIVLCENYRCNNLRELLKRESEYILKNHCVNKVIPYKEDSIRVEYNCDLCNTLINIKSKQRHLRSFSHNQLKKKKLYECKICNKSINKKSKKRHVLSLSHINNKQKINIKVLITIIFQLLKSLN
jgi:hypothetical protein